MPLLSLPRELLLDIIGYVATSDSSRSLSTAWAPRTFSQSCTLYPDVVSLAHTCQLLRFLSITSMYSSVTGYKGFELILHQSVASSSHIASCIRRITLVLPYLRLSQPATPNLQLIRGILSKCTKLQALRLSGHGIRDTEREMSEFDENLLEHLALESKRSITTFELHDMGLNSVLAYLTQLSRGDQGVFGALKTVSIMNCDVSQVSGLGQSVVFHDSLSVADIHTALKNKWKGGKLDRVQTFSLETDSWEEFKKPDVVGVYFGRLMLNVRVLDLETDSACSFGILGALVTFPSQLTELTLSFGRYGYKQRKAFCDIISKLSQTLTKYVVHGSYICQKLFAAGNWPHLVLLDIKCHHHSTCGGFMPDLLRAGLETLTQTHPAADISVAVLGTPGFLVSWGRPPKRDDLSRYSYGFEEDISQEQIPKNTIAPLEIFENLDPSTYQEDSWDSGPEDYDDYGLNSD